MDKNNGKVCKTFLKIDVEFSVHTVYLKIKSRKKMEDGRWKTEVFYQASVFCLRFEKERKLLGLIERRV